MSDKNTSKPNDSPLESLEDFLKKIIEISSKKNYIFRRENKNYKKAIEYESRSYNLSCVYALKGTKEKALKFLTYRLIC